MSTSAGPSSAPPEAPAAAKRRVPEWVVRAAQLFALSGIAVAQPIFDLLGNNAAFFVAHDASTGQILMLTFVLLLVPPAIALAVVQVISAIKPAAGRVAMQVAVGVLAAMIITPPLDRALGFSTVVFLLVAAVIAIGAALLYGRFAPVRTFTTFLSFAPVLFAIVFVFFSQVGDLIFADEAEAFSRVSGLRTPVVVLVLDELTLGSILDENGHIDEQRFPGLAQLAAHSTWYRDAGSPSSATTLAVPALLSGTLPEPDSLPTSSDHPRNLFTLLGRTHQLHVDELVTDLCPESLCGESATAATSGLGMRQLFKDAGIVYLHQLLPDGLADSWLPVLGERWASFDEDPAADLEDAGRGGRPIGEDEPGESGADQRARLDTFLAGIQPQAGGQPPLHFLHVLLPHVPYTYLPDGQRYPNPVLPLGVDSDTGLWADDDYLSTLGRQQYMLQTEFVDRQITRLLDRLRETGLWDDALVVVTADHGVNFTPGGHLRGKPVDDESRDDIMPVPLFIKYPGQERGRVDDRVAQTTDVLPTIADALGIDLPDDWRSDGRSLLDEPDGHRRYVFVDERSGDRTEFDELDPERAAGEFRAVLGDPGQAHDLYRIAPHGDLVGRPASDLPTGPPIAGAVQLRDPTAYDAVDPAGLILPVRFSAVLDGIAPGQWVAISLNGVIGGVGRVADVAGEPSLVVMLDPSLLRAGRNDLAYYVVDGEQLRPIG